ncbi:hypothetical protein ES703_120541 [subsurface metagenome]
MLFFNHRENPPVNGSRDAHASFIPVSLRATSDGHNHRNHERYSVPGICHSQHPSRFPLHRDSENCLRYFSSAPFKDPGKPDLYSGKSKREERGGCYYSDFGSAGRNEDASGLPQRKMLSAARTKRRGSLGAGKNRVRIPRSPSHPVEIRRSPIGKAENVFGLDPGRDRKSSEGEARRSER